MVSGALEDYLVALSTQKFASLCFWLGIPRRDGVHQIACPQERSRALVTWLAQRNRLQDLHQEMLADTEHDLEPEPLAPPPRPPLGRVLPTSEPSSWSDWLQG